MASPNISEILSTTLENRSGDLFDNVSKNNALLYRLKKRGNVKTFSGGATIRQGLEYAENSTYKRYSGYETLDIRPSDVFTEAEFTIKQAAVAITISGLEQLKNSGKEQLIDLLESRIKNAEKTLINNIAADVYSDGTADGGKQIGGLQHLVADTPTNTVGGIDRGTWTFWKNKVFSGVSNGGVAVNASNIQDYLLQIVLDTTRGADKPDIGIFDNTYYSYLHASMAAIQRLTNPELADAGFRNITCHGVDCVFDGGYGGNAPSAHAYLLNTSSIHFRPHKDRNFVPFGGDRQSVNQDAVVKLLGFAGNMTLSCGFLQGVLKA